MILDDQRSASVVRASTSPPGTSRCSTTGADPVLTWWEGKVVSGHGVGEYVIFDGSYREIARVQAGNGYQGRPARVPHHPAGHGAAHGLQPGALRTSPTLGGPEDGQGDGGYSPGGGHRDRRGPLRVAQPGSRRRRGVLHQACLTDPISLDYFHINSIDVDHDDNLLLSARNTSAVYKIERESGEVLWRLGGKKSDFEMGEGTRDAPTSTTPAARRTAPSPSSTTAPDPKVHEQSRGIVVELDEEEMSATLVREYTHPDEAALHLPGQHAGPAERQRA